MGRVFYFKPQLWSDSDIKVNIALLCFHVLHSFTCICARFFLPVVGFNCELLLKSDRNSLNIFPTLDKFLSCFVHFHSLMLWASPASLPLFVCVYTVQEIAIQLPVNLSYTLHSKYSSKPIVNVKRHCGIIHTPYIIATSLCGLHQSVVNNCKTIRHLMGLVS